MTGMERVERSLGETDQPALEIATGFDESGRLVFLPGWSRPASDNWPNAHRIAAVLLIGAMSARQVRHATCTGAAQSASNPNASAD